MWRKLPGELPGRGAQDPRGAACRQEPPTQGPGPMQVAMPARGAGAGDLAVTAEVGGQGNGVGDGAHPGG